LATRDKPDAAGALAVTPMEQAECELIQQALGKHRDNKSAAARYLGIGRATMYRKLRAFGRSD
jgi:sigma-54 dependent transcriptional regulator, acetoin dehydrogenase operon transcriptional activator AcoR